MKLPKIGSTVKLLHPLLSANGNVLAAPGENAVVVGHGECDGVMLEFSHNVGGFSGEMNRRWATHYYYSVVKNRHKSKLSSSYAHSL